jgi:hypothetical protein
MLSRKPTDLGAGKLAPSLTHRCVLSARRRRSARASYYRASTPATAADRH